MQRCFGKVLNVLPHEVPPFLSEQSGGQGINIPRPNAKDSIICHEPKNVIDFFFGIFKVLDHPPKSDYVVRFRGFDLRETAFMNREPPLLCNVSGPLGYFDPFNIIVSSGDSQKISGGTSNV